ncbi:MAG: trehalose-phosphatase [Dehalococcoidales bacterium]|nr:MAG: trehalose-phosphatase [Dehalococcoidales bacterium]
MNLFFESWETFSSEILAASHTLLLSDYDGTLTPIVGRPQDAVLSNSMGTKLRTLINYPDFSIGIISGRSLPEIKEMVRIQGIYYAGNHGLEIDGPGLIYINPQARETQMIIKDIARKLDESLRHIDGIIIEDKNLSLSIHYRLVEERRVKQIVEVFRNITSSAMDNGKIRISSGKKVLEVKPFVDWHKGKAAEMIIEKIENTTGSKVKMVIYLGDDSTDEDAFKTVRRRHGWSIFVGPEGSSSEAEYSLESVQDVETFLARLLELK